LLEVEKTYRLGSQNLSELKEHDWFTGFDFAKLYKKDLVPPFVPQRQLDFPSPPKIKLEQSPSMNPMRQKILNLLNMTDFKDFYYNRYSLFDKKNTMFKNPYHLKSQSGKRLNKYKTYSTYVIGKHNNILLSLNDNNNCIINLNIVQNEHVSENNYELVQISQFLKKKQTEFKIDVNKMSKIDSEISIVN
jgi:hypothetical protein